MRVQHNILAMNSYRNYNNNTRALGKNLEKLSSGYRINRAGDDAAGLAISEKMRAQIQGLNAAQKNVKDAISFVKTAEGAMQEIQDMLGRMKYLATQSANGTYENLVDREALQDEVDQLKEEINRIADSANFNGIYMLNGGNAGDITDGGGEVAAILTKLGTNELQLDADKITVAFDSKVTTEMKNALAEALSKTTLTVETASNASGAPGIQINDGDTIRISGLDALDGFTVKYVDASGVEETLPNTDIVLGQNAGNIDMRKPVILKVYSSDGNTLAATINLDKIYKGFGGLDSKPGTSKITFSAKDKVGTMDTENGDVKATGKLEDFGITGIDFSKVKGLADGAPVKVKFTDDKMLTITIGSVEYSYKFDATDSNASDIKGKTLTLTSDGKNGSITVSIATDDDKVKIGADKDAIAEKTVGAYVAPKAGGTYSITMQIGDSAAEQLTIDVDSMTTDSLGVSEVKISDVDSAHSAIDTVKDAINKVSSARGNLGAYQNRLEHTANNLSVMTENIQDAESTIRDTDVAEEMMGYVKNNILVQSAQSMLAQANQVPQGVLQLMG